MIMVVNNDVYAYCTTQAASYLGLLACQQEIILLIVTSCGHRACNVQMELKLTVAKTHASLHFCHVLKDNI